MMAEVERISAGAWSYHTQQGSKILYEWRQIVPVQHGDKEAEMDDIITAQVLLRKRSKYIVGVKVQVRREPLLRWKLCQRDIKAVNPCRRQQASG